MEDTSAQSRLIPKNKDVLQLYSAATPNGLKVSACLEEIAALKDKTDAFDYEPHTVDIRHQENRKEECKQAIPSGKIPTIIDPNGPNGKVVQVFESGSILIYLAEKYDELIPHDLVEKTAMMNWLFWGSTSFSSQVKAFGFYYKYCPRSLTYCIERYAQEVKRLLGVLETHLKHEKSYIVGDMYTIADIAIWPWVYALHENYGDAISAVFGDLVEFKNVKAWYLKCVTREASQKAMDVCPFLN